MRLPCVHAFYALILWPPGIPASLPQCALLTGAAGFHLLHTIPAKHAVTPQVLLSQAPAAVKLASNLGRTQGQGGLHQLLGAARQPLHFGQPVLGAWSSIAVSRGASAAWTQCQDKDSARAHTQHAHLLAS